MSLISTEGMTDLTDMIPRVIIERSLAFKSLIIIAGAITLLISTLIRSDYPNLWIGLFLFGALIEWLIVATVYAEMTELEENIVQTKAEVTSTKNRAVEIRSEVEDTKDEIKQIRTDVEGTKNDIFAFSSDSQGVGDSLEKRVATIEKEVGVGRRSGGRGSLESRVSSLEDELGKF